ncbi:MAG: hypothetical protein F6J98_40025 [Moorea sp. SIO4G2]|uniref:hypothetical protein n=1 Tax=unclassified Moorena TaxID=2683338 RepID=UPI0013F80F44|nr:MULTISPECIES: hypothetical protein [unclassified Moorena]NEO17456.1 hypothetical protein [Moorena sp. SIO3E8]NEO66242.1 hypothetical protein [Moorena sp. SIO4G2]NEQ04003.1 hypothetical protein [Moorena sp. SIO3F7]
MVSGQWSAVSGQWSVVSLFYSKAPQVAMQRGHGGFPQDRAASRQPAHSRSVAIGQ